MLDKIKNHKNKFQVFIGVLSYRSLSLAKNIANLTKQGKENVFKDLIEILITLANGMKWVILLAGLVLFAFNVFKHVANREPDYFGALSALCQLLIILAITFNVENFVSMIYGITIIH